MNAMLKPIEIVNVENGEPMTTTLQIALGLGIQHATIIKLVRTYMPDFQEFGLVRFKIQPRLEGQISNPTHSDLKSSRVNSTYCF